MGNPPPVIYSCRWTWGSWNFRGFHPSEGKETKGTNNPPSNSMISQCVSVFVFEILQPLTFTISTINRNTSLVLFSEFVLNIYCFSKCCFLKVSELHKIIIQQFAQLKSEGHVYVKGINWWLSTLSCSCLPFELCPSPSSRDTGACLQPTYLA